MKTRRLMTLMAGLSVLAGITASGPVLAESPKPGPFYAGIGLGVGFDNFDTGDLDPDIDTAFGLDAWGGYRINEWAATELQLEWLTGFDTKIFGVKIDGQVVSFGGNLKVFPLASVLTHRVEPFLMAGPGFTWAELDAGQFGTGDDLDFSARFGGGIDFYVTDAIALQVSSSYVLTTGEVEDFDYVSLVTGLQFRF